jgi:uncharacterized SAM-dependent methyltransferase
LIDYFLRRKIDFTYSPIDISREAVDVLTDKFTAEFPQLRIEAQIGDYFRILETLKSTSKRRKILLFLGSNIGNFFTQTVNRIFRQPAGGYESQRLAFRRL